MKAYQVWQRVGDWEEATKVGQFATQGQALERLATLKSSDGVKYAWIHIDEVPVLRTKIALIKRKGPASEYIVKAFMTLEMAENYINGQPENIRPSFSIEMTDYVMEDFE